MFRPDHFGVAGFLYTLADASGATSTAKVEIYVTPVNDAPRAHNTQHSVRLETTATLTVADLLRSEERRVGTERARTCRSRRAPDTIKTTQDTAKQYSTI